MTETSKETLENLVEKARAGNRQAFSDIVRQLMNQVVALTYRMTGERESALDLAQDTFVAAWEKLESFRGDASFASWVYRIASNKALNYLKSNARQVTSGEIQEPVAPENIANPAQQLYHRELADNIRKFMASLPTQQRLIFELRFYKEMTFKEIAETTDRALGTVKTGYREAIKKLRVFAQEEGWHR